MAHRLWPAKDEVLILGNDISLFRRAAGAVTAGGVAAAPRLFLVAAGVLGHPALGIAWLANKVAPFGTVLEPGHVVLSGSFTRPVWAAKGDTLHADFGPLGSLAVQFV